MYCFGPRNIRDMSFRQLKKLFYLFHHRGARAVVLTGGEPLVRDDFQKIIKELKENKLKVFLDTNGDFFFKYRDLISQYVDVLGLPIDFSDRSYRSKNNFKKVLKILDYYKNLKRRPTIRIGTVVTKDNFKKLDKIGQLLRNYSVDIWKLYQFTPQNINAVRNRVSLEIPQEQFNRAVQGVKDKFSKYFRVVISRREYQNRAYFFVNPDGTVFMPIDDLDVCREKKIGNIFDKNIVAKWRKFISKSNYINNAKVTFNYKF